MQRLGEVGDARIEDLLGFGEKSETMSPLALRTEASIQGVRWTPLLAKTV